MHAKSVIPQYPSKGDAIITPFVEMKKWKPIFAQDHKGSSRTGI